MSAHDELMYSGNDLDDLEELSKSALRAGYDELMYNDLLDMQEHAFDLINEKAKERCADEFDAREEVLQKLSELKNRASLHLDRSQWKNHIISHHILEIVDRVYSPLVELNTFRVAQLPIITLSDGVAHAVTTKLLKPKSFHIGSEEEVATFCKELTDELISLSDADKILYIYEPILLLSQIMGGNKNISIGIRGAII